MYNPCYELMSYYADGSSTYYQIMDRRFDFRVQFFSFKESEHSCICYESLTPHNGYFEKSDPKTQQRIYEFIKKQKVRRLLNAKESMIAKKDFENISKGQTENEPL